MCIENKDNCNFSLGFGKYRIEIDDYTNPVFSFDIDFSDADFCGSNPDYYKRIRIDYYSNNNITYNYIDNDGITNFNPISISSESVINVWELQGTPHQGWFTQNKGDFTEASDVPAFLTWPLIATGTYQSMSHLNSDNFNLNLRISNHNVILNAINQLNPVIFKNCKLIIDDGNVLTINRDQNPYPQLEIIGDNAKFISKNGSAIIMPQDFILWIKDGASIESISTHFDSDNSSVIWSQIALSNTKNVKFEHCEFNNAYTPIISEYNMENEIKFFDCTFRNIYSTNICVTKAYNVWLINNHFWLGAHDPVYSDGIIIYQPSNSEDEDNLGYGINVNIIGNDFHGGRVQLSLVSYASTLFPVYVNSNYFYDGQQNIYTTNCNGNISYNTINSSLTYNYAETYCYGSYWSSPDFLSNVFTGKYNNLELYDFNCPNLAPLETEDGTIIWIAGRNSLTSIDNRNVNCWGPHAPNFFITENGRNNFILENSNVLHFSGYMNTEDIYYYSSNNCWYRYGTNVSPSYWLKNNNGTNMRLIQNPPPYIGCYSWDYQIIDRIITDRGNGIYDTILITQANNTPPPTEDVALYGTAVKNQKLKNYSSSISNFKNLINNYPNSKYFEKTIYNLYECYVASDTNHNQGWRNVIFSDLKSYLENKIQQYDTNQAFVNLAFDFLLKCKIKLKSYQPAMDGYEFIAENSPSANERLMASINYIDVEGLLPGGSGGQNEKQIYEDELSIDINGKPIKEILLASYNKSREEKIKIENRELINSNDVAQTKSVQDKKHQQEKVLENRALENIRISGSLTKKERRDRIQKDLMLLHQRSDFTEKTIKKNSIESFKYELSQNYPNPFNPITNIKYQTQKAGLVTLKIYDITGREIKTLVNEIKNPGSYIVTFNGSELASGVYFYRIQSGDFVQVKKMLMIK